MRARLDLGVCSSRARLTMEDVASAVGPIPLSLQNLLRLPLANTRDSQSLSMDDVGRIHLSCTSVATITVHVMSREHKRSGDIPYSTRNLVSIPEKLSL